MSRMNFTVNERGVGGEWKIWELQETKHLPSKEERQHIGFFFSYPTPRVLNLNHKRLTVHYPPPPHPPHPQAGNVWARTSLKLSEGVLWNNLPPAPFSLTIIIFLFFAQSAYNTECLILNFLPCWLPKWRWVNRTKNSQLLYGSSPWAIHSFCPTSSFFSFFLIRAKLIAVALAKSQEKLKIAYPPHPPPSSAPTQASHWVFPLGTSSGESFSIASSGCTRPPPQ